MIVSSQGLAMVDIGLMIWAVSGEQPTRTIVEELVAGKQFHNPVLCTNFCPCATTSGRHHSTFWTLVAATKATTC